MGSLPGDSPTPPTSGITTLWANDELRSAFSFDSGDYAVDLVDGQAVLDRAQILFHQLEPDKLSVGFSLAQSARLVDLGDVKVEGVFRPADQTFHPPVSIFHTLFRENRSFYYRGPLSRTYAAKNADSVFFTLNNTATSFVPELGHTYLLRYAPRKSSGGSEDKIVKFRVVDYEPARQMTIRWAQMQ